MKKKLFDLVKLLDAYEGNGIHIFDLRDMDEMAIEIYRVYTGHGYCFQICHNTDYNPECSETEEYEFYSNWDGFQKGLTPEMAYEIVQKEKDGEREIKSSDIPIERTIITESNGEWFSKVKAKKYEEKTYWNGNSIISFNTNSQSEHETLYETIGGTWIKERNSDRINPLTSYFVIGELEAAIWLLKNEHEAPDDMQHYINQLEIL